MERITADKIRDLTEVVFSSYSKKARVAHIWKKPIVVTAIADDRFKSLSEIAHSGHLLPWELLPTARSIVVFFVPFSDQIIIENSLGPLPSRSWAIAYMETNRLIYIIENEIESYLAKEGYRSKTTPPTHDFDPVGLVSRWSHKHIACLSGLGRFGHNAQIITPLGCAGRLGSLVTEANLGDSPVMVEGEVCLFRAGNRCLKCAENCPVGALNDWGIDRKLCFDRLRFNRENLIELSDLPENTHVCGKCVVNVPCSFKNPVIQ